MEIKVQQEGNFEFVEEGEGPVLLLLHGLFGALSNWQDVLANYSNKYKVVIPLMPIYEMPLRNSNVGGLSDFIQRFIEFKGYEKVNLLGNSLGGHVALVYALEHPEKVHSMVLTGSSGLYENAMGESFPRRNSYSFIKSKVEYTFYDPDVASKELVDEVYNIVNDRQKSIRIISMAKSSIRHNLKQEIKNIFMPVCLIWGNDDRITPPHVADEFYRLMPHSEVHYIDKCGHAPMMERPEEFNQTLEAFLNKIIKSPNPQNA